MLETCFTLLGDDEFRIDRRSLTVSQLTAMSSVLSLPNGSDADEATAAGDG